MSEHRPGAARIHAYVTTTCGFCHRALRLLHDKGVAFCRVDVTGDRKTRNWLVQATGQHTVPQIFIDGKSIGGYTDLAALDRAGKLDQMLAEPAPETPCPPMPRAEG
jgi:glutaredoxin 3